jgi:hypothetical protein
MGTSTYFYPQITQIAKIKIKIKRRYSAVVFSHCRRNLDDEPRALLFSRVDLDRAAVVLGDAVADGKAQPRAFGRPLVLKNGSNTLSLTSASILLKFLS